MRLPSSITVCFLVAESLLMIQVAHAQESCSGYPRNSPGRSACEARNWDRIRLNRSLDEAQQAREKAQQDGQRFREEQLQLQRQQLELQRQQIETQQGVQRRQDEKVDQQQMSQAQETEVKIALTKMVMAFEMAIPLALEKPPYLDRYQKLVDAGQCKAASDLLIRESRGADKKLLIALEFLQIMGTKKSCEKEVALWRPHLARAAQLGSKSAKELLDLFPRIEQANSGSTESASAKTGAIVDKEAAELAKRVVQAAEANQVGPSRLPPCPGSYSRDTTWTNCVGTYVWGTTPSSPNGYNYVGEWRNHRKTGHGTLTFPDGGRYVGEFTDDNFHGHGSLTLPNGEKYVGEWRRQIKAGHGIEYRPDGSILRSGIWHNNVFLRGQEELSEQQAAQERLRVALELQAQQEQRRLEEKAEADRRAAKAKAETRAKHASPRPGEDVKEKGDTGSPAGKEANTANSPTTIPADPSTAADVKKKPSVKVKSAMDL